MSKPKGGSLGTLERLEQFKRHFTIYFVQLLFREEENSETKRCAYECSEMIIEVTLNIIT